MGEWKNVQKCLAGRLNHEQDVVLRGVGDIRQGVVWQPARGWVLITIGMRDGEGLSFRDLPERTDFLLEASEHFHIQKTI